MPLKKKMPYIVMISSIVLWGLVALYLCGILIEYRTYLTYIYPINILGKVIMAIGIPCWALGLLCYFFSIKKWKLWQRMLTVILAVLLIGWSFVSIVTILFTTEEDHKLIGNYRAVQIDMYNPDYQIQKTKYIVFREPCNDSKEVEQLYLEDKYKDSFKMIEYQEMGDFGHSMEWLADRTIWVSKTNPDVPIIIFLNGFCLEDTYVDYLLDWYNYQVVTQVNNPDEDPIAKKIYDTELLKQGICSKFELQYSSKGVPYYNLGEDGAFRYTLIYDRCSKNETCLLYVLYQSPFHEDTKNYVPYTDQDTQIRDIYAVKKDSEEIISSGKHTWSDVGNAEYREATGE